MSISPWGPCWQDRAASLTNGRQHQRKLMIAFVKGRVPDHTVRPASQLGAQSCNIAACRLPMIAAIWRDEGGVIAILTALALTLLIGIVGLAVDVGMWDRTNRALQNAADAAVIAAALNGTGSYQNEAKGRRRPVWVRRRSQRHNRHGAQQSNLSGWSDRLLPGHGRPGLDAAILFPGSRFV